MLEWRAAAVESGEGKPTPAEWNPVDVPGRPAAFAGADRVAYRTTFADPRDPGEAMAVLRLDGLYDGGTVWVDGERVAETDSVVEPVSVPFEPDAETEVVVACDAPDDRFGGIHDTDRVPAEESVPGVWWVADVTTHPDTFVLDVGTTARLADGGERGVIEATARVYAREGVDDRLTLTTRPTGETRGRGVMDRTTVEAEAGEVATTGKTIELRDPSLWSPRGLGTQDRYEVRAKLGDDVATATTGFATVEYDDGLVVNGDPVSARGVTLQDGTPEDVERALDVNANLVRGHAHALAPSVYEACDESGLLVWQDLPLTGPGEFDVDRGRGLVGELVDRYGGHPSLAAMTTHDEPTRTFATRVGGGTLGRLRLRWRLWRSSHDRGPAEAVAEAVPAGVATVPVVGDPASDPDAAALYPGWDFGSVDDADWLRGRFDRGDVVGEFGTGSLAVAEPEATAGFDRAKHDAVVDGGGVAASQAYQAHAVRTVAERLRADGAPVVVANALRDVGEAGMGVYGRDGEAKRAAEALATAFEPVRAVLPDPGTGEREAVVVNDTPRNQSVTLTWAAASGEEPVADGESELTVRATARADTRVSIPAGATTVELRVRTDEGATTVSYDLP
ncbi:MAG: hydrolase [Haloarculaceae archaeon]